MASKVVYRRVGTVIPHIVQPPARNAVPAPPVSGYLLETRMFGSRVEAYTAIYWAARNWARGLPNECHVEVYHTGGAPHDVYLHGVVDGLKDAGDLDGRRVDVDLKVWETDLDSPTGEIVWVTHDDTIFMIGQTAAGEISRP